MTKAEITKLFWEDVCRSPCLHVTHETFADILFDCSQSCSDYFEGRAFERYDYSVEFVFNDNSKLLFQYDVDEDGFVESNCEVL